MKPGPALEARGLRIREDPDRLTLEFPLLPRLRKHLAWGIAAVAWPALAFQIAALRGLDGIAAMSLAILPPIGAMVVGVRPLVSELCTGPIVLTRKQAGIAVGAVAPLASGAFAVSVTERRRRIGRTSFVVRFTAAAPVREIVVELVILKHEFRTVEETSAVASALARFTGVGVRGVAAS